MVMVTLSIIIFLLALLLLLVKNNFIFILFGLELMLLAVNMNFLYTSVYLDDFAGQLIALTLFAIAATDTAIGLALLLNYYNIRSNPSSFFEKGIFLKTSSKNN